MFVVQQLGVTLGHVVTFDEPAPDVSVPTPLSAVTRNAGMVSFPSVICFTALRVCLDRAQLHQAIAMTEMLQS